MAASLQMLTMERLFIVCNRETFAVRLLNVQDGVSGQAGWLAAALRGVGGRRAPRRPPLLLLLPWAPGWQHRRLWGRGVPGLVAGVRGAAEPRPSVRPCVRGFTSRKFQETPREGASRGRARALSQQMCLQGPGAGREGTNLALKTFVCSQ